MQKIDNITSSNNKKLLKIKPAKTGHKLSHCCIERMLTLQKVQLNFVDLC